MTWVENQNKVSARLSTKLFNRLNRSRYSLGRIRLFFPSGFRLFPINFFSQFNSFFGSTGGFPFPSRFKVGGTWKVCSFRFLRTIPFGFRRVKKKTRIGFSHPLVDYTKRKVFLFRRVFNPNRSSESFLFPSACRLTLFLSSYMIPLYSGNFWDLLVQKKG